MRFVESRMPRTVVGGVLGVLGFVILVCAAWASINAPRMADTLQILADGQTLPFDPAHWQAHWRMASGVEAVLGIGILFAGVGLLRRSRWGLLAFCIAISVFLTWMVAMRTFGVYPWEEASLSETLTVSFLCLAFWVLLWRKRGPC
jgi:hypothetical protein